MANEGNLLKGEDTHKFTLEEQRKGGVASGEARRKRRALKEELEMLLEKKSKDGRTYQEVMSVSLIKEAIDGNTRAFEIIRDTIGEKPIEVQQVIEKPIIIDDID